MSSARLRETALEHIRALMEHHGIGLDELPRVRERHGMSKSREYIVFKQAKSRCVNPKDKDYSAYGGRGIAFSPEWENSFEQFMADMGPCPEGAILKRRDVGAGYSKENCYWAPRSEMNQGKRKGGNPPRVFVEIDGVSKPLRDWAKEKGVSYQAAYWRLKNGVPAGKAFDPVVAKSAPESQKQEPDAEPAERREPPLTVGGLRERCDVQRESGCWLWKGAVTHGHPRVYTHCHERGERRVMLGKTAAWNIAHGRAPQQGHKVVQACCQPLCLNPAHLKERRKRAEQLDLLAGV